MVKKKTTAKVAPKITRQRKPKIEIPQSFTINVRFGEQVITIKDVSNYFIHTDSYNLLSVNRHIEGRDVCVAQFAKWDIVTRD